MLCQLIRIVNNSLLVVVELVELVVVLGADIDFMSIHWEKLTRISN